MKKILTVIGARPQFIKAAMVSKALQQTQQLSEVVVHTGQHFDANMSAVFFRELELSEPKYNLNINQTPFMLSLMIAELMKVAQSEKPDAVLVYGDTTSTLAGALAASTLHIPLVHVEAGMRNYRLDSAEEINRVITDRVSSVLFCASNQALKNLSSEGYEKLPCHISFTGDVMYDALLHFKSVANNKPWSFPPEWKAGYFVCTIHRAETVDKKEKFSALIAALNDLSKANRIVMPLHPRTRQRIEEFGLKPTFTIIDPLGYLDTIQLVANAKLVMTDSGGLQKEAFFLQKKALILRECTEWSELTENGFALLVNPDYSGISQQINTLFETAVDFSQPFFGDGNAASKMAGNLLTFLSR